MAPKWFDHWTTWAGLVTGGPDPWTSLARYATVWAQSLLAVPNVTACFKVYCTVIHEAYTYAAEICEAIKKYMSVKCISRRTENGELGKENMIINQPPCI